MHLKNVKQAAHTHTSHHQSLVTPPAVRFRLLVERKWQMLVLCCSLTTMSNEQNTVSTSGNSKLVHLRANVPVGS